jgi:hypothetical protein
MYITYTCSVCRRTKDIEQDSKRAAPNLCTITKGCGGRLINTGQTSVLTPTSPVAGLEDWYARGQRITSPAAEVVEDDVSIATSNEGAISLAVADSGGVMPETITMNLLQRKEGAVPFNQYTFRLTSALSVISGKDVNGRNLRFSTSNVEQGQVYVRVNGVINTDVVLTQDTLTFPEALPSNSIVDVIVYLAPVYTAVSLIFTRNSSKILSVARGSWMNVDYVQRWGAGIKSKFILYSVDLVNLGSGKMQFSNINFDGDCFFCLAAPPYEAPDRYYTFAVDCADITDFSLYVARDTNHMTVPADLVKEVFPLLQVPATGLIEADEAPAGASSLIQRDESTVRKQTKKIIGPT